MSKHKLWTQAEIEYLSEYWVPLPGRITVHEAVAESIAAKLGRNPTSIRSKANSIGLNARNRKNRDEMLNKKHASAPEPTQLPIATPIEEATVVAPMSDLTVFAETLLKIKNMSPEQIETGIALGYYHPSLRGIHA